MTSQCEEGDRAGIPRRPGRASARFVTSVLSTVIVATCLVALTTGAVHGVRGTTALSSNRETASWELDVRYWDCLDVQAHSLVAPDQRVWMDTTNLVALVTLIRVFGPWAALVDSPRLARVYVTVRSGVARGGCLGTLVVGMFDGPRGPGSVLRTGTGASMPGSPLELPSTPL